MVPLLTDEDVPGDIVSGLRQVGAYIDLLRVQDVGLMHTADPSILEWAAQGGRVTVSRDRQTMIGFAYARVKQGMAMPGLLILPSDPDIGQAVSDLGLIALASEPEEWKDRVVFLPL